MAFPMSIDGFSPLRLPDCEPFDGERLAESAAQALRESGVRKVSRKGAEVTFDAPWWGAARLSGCHGSLTLLKKDGLAVLGYHISYGRWAVAAGLLVPAVSALLFQATEQDEAMRIFVLFLLAMPIAWLGFLVLVQLYLAVPALRAIKARLEAVGPGEG